MYKNKNRSVRIPDKIREVADVKCEELGITFNRLIVNLLEIYLGVNDVKQSIKDNIKTNPENKKEVNIKREPIKLFNQ